MSDRHLSLLVSGLFGPGGTEDVPTHDLKELETYLARSGRMPPVAASGLEATVFALFGINAEPNADLPVAAVTRALDIGVIDQGWWLRADPVHLEPDRDRLILTDSSQLDISQDEANALTAEIMQVYATDGWLLKAARPGRWYLKPPRAARISTTPLPDIVGRDIHPYLPRGPDGKSWHTVLNEMQILLHTAQVNTERERTGRQSINSLWFWGSGQLPNIGPARWAEVWSEDAVSLALARLTETPSRNVPNGVKHWLAQAVRPGEHLVVLDQGRAAVQYGDVEGWLEVVRRLNREWITPLQSTLRNRSLASVTLYTDTGHAFRLDRRSAGRWWRRRIDLAGFR